MEERKYQFRVGATVIIGLLALAILIVLFGELPKIIRGKYTIHIWLREAPSVSANTPVRKSGLLIGRVTKVRFADEVADPEVIRLVKDLQGIDEEEFYTGVVITAEIEKGKNIYPGEVARVSSSLLGDAVVRIVRPRKLNPPPEEKSENKEKTREKVTDGEWIRGTVVDDPIDAITDLKESLSKAIDSVTVASGDLGNASKELGGAARHVSDLLDTNKEGISLAILHANMALASVDEIARSANKLIGDEQSQERIRNALIQLPDMLKETRDTIAHMSSAMVLAERNLQNVEKFTQKLGDRELIERIDRGTENLDRLMRDMSTFGQAINSPHGSLGQLVHNPELYQHLNRAAKNIEELTRQLRPIVNDARVFVDKVARHPESLGVRGALQRSPGIK